ncbi:uncharacterized protein LOC132752390 isoform X1 [Ruditapes philippinarum]|uniref:uncharacterized protein LOC132752390 isoform X1 n=1 Tax=Ruditapes philippinarum TaxID=129788 RepID=UPI00295BFD71|nr:uncharacterized protein LOC132752390 isoform X1 [Ruditapes philippinarum]
MGIGDSKDSPTTNFNRRDPKRRSKKKERMEIQEGEKLEQAKIKDKCLRDLGEILAQHVDKLNNNDKTTEIKSLLDILEEHKTKDISYDMNGEVTEAQQFRETIERIEVVLKEYKEFPQRLKDSFKGVTKDIYSCVAENMQEHNQLINRKTSIRRKNSRAKEIKHQIGVSATVQIYYTPDGIMNDIQKVLQTTLRSELGAVKFIPVCDKSEINDDMLLIITCNVSSRVVSDAVHAMKDITNSANAALLLIHVGEAHTFSNTNSSLHLTGNEFNNLRGIYDMFFVKSNHDFLRCDMNKNSIKGLCSFCKGDPCIACIESTHF